MLHQLARFRSVVPHLLELGGGTVLDVGSGSEGVASWLDPRFAVTAVDTSFEDIGAMRGPADTSARRVAGDIRELPFEDGEFDAVLALDVLEHVEPADRERAVSEVVRTARRRAVIACPAGDAALAADRRLAAGLRRRGLEPPSWLVEHEACGFPEPDELRAWMGGAGRVRLVGDENVRWHGWLFAFEFRRPGAHVSRSAARRLAGSTGAAGRVAMRLVHGPRRPPFYRTIAILDL